MEKRKCIYFRNELRTGLRRNLFFYVGAVILTIIFTMHALQSVAFEENESKLYACIAMVFRGAPACKPKEWAALRIPVEYFVLHTLLYFLVGNYLERDLYGYGIYRLVASNDKKVWWNGKVLWNLLSTLLYWLVVEGSMLLTAQLAAKSSMQEWSKEGKKIAWLLVLHFFCETALALMQMLLSFLFHSVAALVVSEGMLIAAVYFPVPMLLNNFEMAQRMPWEDAEGFAPPLGLVLSVLVWLICYAVGGKKAEKLDVLGGGEQS